MTCNPVSSLLVELPRLEGVAAQGARFYMQVGWSSRSKAPKQQSVNWWAGRQ
eukprot:CAMPEP_0179068998 /NCGR_PEP_ID=MMETSP0796-20121207/30283_1 /TAXON_ID=73915 /ORGANISM="Pyrodinium bahamense, Strain pbaha01" /LENGTH=51 /DNA_ID=CAMNT_0020766055 /DNA_START=52 /DNA_END=204 /DNA_ORIENTATION=-